MELNDAPYDYSQTIIDKMIANSLIFKAMQLFFTHFAKDFKIDQFTELSSNWP